MRLVADRRLAVRTPAGSGALALYWSKAWGRPQPAITRAIVTIRGLERAASNARTIAEVGVAPPPSWIRSRARERAPAGSPSTARTAMRGDASHRGPG